MKGRAITPEQKREIVDRVLAAWLKTQHQRLGQFLHNAIHGQGDIFYVEDERLAELCEKLVKE